MFRSVFAPLLATLIVAISPPLASAQTGKCAAVPEGLEKLRLAEAPAVPGGTAFSTGDGEERKLADYRGRGVVLNFWATWCAPCVREMPALDRLHAPRTAAAPRW